MLTSGMRIKQRCDELSMTLKSACTAAKINYPTLSQQIIKDRPIPFATIDALAHVLNVPLEFFSQRRSSMMVTPIDVSEQSTRAGEEATREFQNAEMISLRSGVEFSTDDVLDWLDREKGVLRNFDALQDRVDLFYPPKESDAAVRPAHLGKSSLATRFFDLQSPEDYAKKFETFDSDTRQNVLTTHLAVQKSSSFRVDDVDISVLIGGKLISGRYRRIMAPVTSLQSEPLTFVWAKLIRAFSSPSNV